MERTTESPATSNTPAADETFAKLGLSPATLTVIEQLGFERPTPIQAQTIPLLLEGRELLALREVGTAIGDGRHDHLGRRGTPARRKEDEAHDRRSGDGCPETTLHFTRR